MARGNRIIGRSGYMHIVKRGINHQDIFIDKSDYEFFLKLLLELKEEMKFEIIAYCLMSNHFHLLVHDDNAQFSKIVQRLMTRYVMHFNWKYNRTGSLCEGRYTGRVIENESYLLTAVRYIHNNPVSAGLSLAEEYQWSSYPEYIGKVPAKHRLCNTDLILSLFSNKDTFMEFHRAVIHLDNYEQINDMHHMEGKSEIADIDIRSIVKVMTGSDEPFILQRLEKEERDKVIRYLKKLRVPMAQLVRITGLNIGVIKRA